MKKKISSPRKGVLAGGNWIVDQVKIIDVLPQREKLANILDQAQGTGGSPYNLLVDLARLGVSFPLMAAGLVGKDDIGQSILKDCARHKISTRYMGQTDLAPSSYTDVMTEKSNGRRTFFHQRGTNALWKGEDLDFDQISARIFHLGYLLLLDAMDAPDSKHGTKAAALLAKARSAGMKTSIDVVSEDSDRFGKIVKPALKHVDYCIINEFEAGKITGFQCRDASDKLDTVALRHAAGAILQCGVRELVVIHFPEGGFARTFDGRDYWQSSLKLPQKYVLGSAGAGDAFCSGVMYGLHEDWDLAQCLFTGVCVAAASLAHPTCTEGVGDLDTCLALAKKYRPGKSLDKD